MDNCKLWIGVALGLTGSAGYGRCQVGPDAVQQNARDLSVYESFFRQVAQLPKTTPEVLLNGKATHLVQPRLKDALGLTDEESRELHSIANDCESGRRLLDKAATPLVFEIRLYAVAGENPPAAVTQRFQELGRQRRQLILHHIKQMKVALGDSRFQLVEAFIRSRRNSPSFFPFLPVRSSDSPLPSIR